VLELFEPFKLQVYHNRERIFINEKDILSVEGRGSYCKIYMLDGSGHLITKNLGQMSSEIKSKFLIRVHRSYVINKNMVTSYKAVGNELHVDMGFGVQAMVSRKYRKIFKELVA
jgi:DNA-binding LytR/AlgR family response regulator